MGIIRRLSIADPTKLVAGSSSPKSSVYPIRFEEAQNLSTIALFWKWTNGTASEIAP